MSNPRQAFRFLLVGLASLVMSTAGFAQEQKEQPAQPQPRPQLINPKGQPPIQPGKWPPQRVGEVGNIPNLRIVNGRQLNTVSPEQYLDLDRIKRARIPQEIQRQVARLASDDFAEREDASRELRSSPLPDELLVAVLEQDVLTAEQRNRMLRVVRWRVRDRPRGAVGIRMSTSRKGVMVTELVPGLPAERVLKVGDQITRINDTEVRSNTGLVGVVQRLLPGTTITMTVLRPITVKDGGPPANEQPDEEPEERIEVEFQLGSYAKLDNEPEALGLTNPETERRNQTVRAIQQRYGATADVLERVIVTDTDSDSDGN